jgi:hypothetical protein
MQTRTISGMPFASAPGRGPTPLMHWELLALRISTRKRTNTRHALGTSCMCFLLAVELPCSPVE